MRTTHVCIQTNQTGNWQQAAALCLPSCCLAAVNALAYVNTYTLPPLANKIWVNKFYFEILKFLV